MVTYSYGRSWYKIKKGSFELAEQNINEPLENPNL